MNNLFCENIQLMLGALISTKKVLLASSDMVAFLAHLLGAYAIPLVSSVVHCVSSVSTYQN